MSANKPPPMKRLPTLALLSLSFLGAQAQYCSPTFLNGCALWGTQQISIGSIDWSIGISDCTVSDYTSIATTITPGVPTAMSVTNGNWCGCAVWIDLDQSQSFEDTENMYYIYVGGDPSYTYDFNITLPANTPPGSYRMRVISPWGSDGVSVGANGYGPCGSYQYGNFEDFTLSVVGSVGIDAVEAQHASALIAPNPTEGAITFDPGASDMARTVYVLSTDGRRVMEKAISAGAGVVQLDLGALPAGLYQVQCQRADGSIVDRTVIKQ